MIFLLSSPPRRTQSGMMEYIDYATLLKKKARWIRYLDEKLLEMRYLVELPNGLVALTEEYSPMRSTKEAGLFLRTGYLVRLPRKIGEVREEDSEGNLIYHKKVSIAEGEITFFNGLDLSSLYTKINIWESTGVTEVDRNWRSFGGKRMGKSWIISAPIENYQNSYYNLHRYCWFCGQVFLESLTHLGTDQHQKAVAKAVVELPSRHHIRPAAQ
jgi:hypothetical protein